MIRDLKLGGKPQWYKTTKRNYVLGGLSAPNAVTFIPGLRDDDFAQLHEMGLAKAYNRSGGSFYFSVHFDSKNPKVPEVQEALLNAAWYPWGLK